MESVEEVDKLILDFLFYFFSSPEKERMRRRKAGSNVTFRVVPSTRKLPIGVKTRRVVLE